jgi:ketopantoate hydroxymethyltransferase
MDFKTSFTANNKEYDLVVPVPMTETDHYVKLVQKGTNNELLRVDANYYNELPSIMQAASTVFPQANTMIDQMMNNAKSSS